MASTKVFVDDVTAAWNQLDADLIVKHLDQSFVYDSQWILDSLDYEGYVNYIRCKFATLRNSDSIIQAETIPDKHQGGYMTKICQTNPATNNSAIVFYRIQINNDKIIKGDLCMFYI